MLPSLTLFKSPLLIASYTSKNHPPTSSPLFAQHYDQCSPHYQSLWGRHIHHGLWRPGKEHLSKEEAQVRLPFWMLFGELQPKHTLRMRVCGCIPTLAATPAQIDGFQSLEYLSIASYCAISLYMDRQSLTFSR